MHYEKPVIVVSKCLNFAHCRFDGSMIGSDVVEALMPYVDFKPYCAEMEIGMPSPRESLRLVRTDKGNRIFKNKSGEDMTDAMVSYSEGIAKELAALEPEGFLLKSRSPSCGVKDTKLYSGMEKASAINKSSKGIFAEVMTEAFPNTIFEDEGRLSNFSIREHFYTVIFTMAAFKALKKQPTMGKLVAFQGRNKYLFMAYSQAGLKESGKLVANHEKKPLAEILEAYEACLHKILARKPAKGQNINVMMHLFGYFSKDLNNEEKAHFMDALEDYRESNIPASTVMAMLYSWALRFGDKYLKEQTVFWPYPKALIKMTDSGKAV